MKKFDLKNVFVALILLCIFLVIIGYFSPTPKSGFKKFYRNTTIGLSFEYPNDWNIGDQSDQSIDITEGDTLESSFHDYLVKNNNGVESNLPYISFGHSPLGMTDLKTGAITSYDNLSIEEQFKVIRCENSDNCKKITNSNGVSYYRYGYACASDGCHVDAVVPTGKYIVSFQVLEGSDSKLPKDSPVISIFDEILYSVKLE